MRYGSNPSADIGVEKVCGGLGSQKVGQRHVSVDVAHTLGICRRGRYYRRAIVVMTSPGSALTLPGMSLLLILDRLVNYRLMKPRSFPFFAFGSFFFGYIFDVTKCMYHIKVPNIESPKSTRNSVMTGRPSACTERRAAGVRIGASQSKPILRMFGCVFFQWAMVATVVVRRRMR
jgi:hypothetical protein